MSDEELKKELAKAAGNNLIEGHKISDAERMLICKTYQSHQGSNNKKALASLLYGLTVGGKDINIEGEKSYGKFQK